MKPDMHHSKSIMGKKEIADNLLRLAEPFIDSYLYSDNAETKGNKYLKAQAIFLIALAKSYLVVINHPKKRRKPRA